MDEFVMEQATELQLDRSDWQLVKFGDVAIQQKESVDRDNTKLTRYVKGEHMGSEDLHLREWGELTDEYLGPAFIRKFGEGDILYGSRRTYLRKVAVAHFDGITSNTTFVIKANEARIDKRLLPFVMLSEGFAEHSIRNSKGSVNPYINWKDIANYEFLLPPKDQQAKLAELLWAMDDVVERNIHVNKTLESLFNTYSFRKFYTYIKKSKNGEIFQPTLGNLLEKSVCNGVFKTREFFGSGTLLINVTDIYNSFKVNPNELERIEVDPKEEDTFSAQHGDVIFNRSSLVRDGIGHSCLVPFHQEKMVFECHLMRVRPKKYKIDSRYLCRYCLSVFGRNYLISRSQTTTMTTINQEALNKMPIPLPSIEEQKNLADYLDNIEKISKHASDKTLASKTFQKSLINQIF